MRDIRKLAYRTRSGEGTPDRTSVPLSKGTDSMSFYFTLVLSVTDEHQASATFTTVSSLDSWHPKLKYVSTEQSKATYYLTAALFISRSKEDLITVFCNHCTWKIYYYVFTTSRGCFSPPSKSAVLRHPSQGTGFPTTSPCAR